MRGEESDHIRFPAGRYYIGDPCYAIQDDWWMDYLNTYPKHKDPHYGWVDGVAVNFKGQKCWHDSTAYGDGCYTGSDGFGYGVDAGIIGIIPTILIGSKEMKEIEELELGRIVEFKHPFTVYCEKDSTFHFGDITIPTDWSYDDEDEEEEEEHYCSSCMCIVDEYTDLCDDCQAEEDADNEGEDDE